MNPNHRTEAGNAAMAEYIGEEPILPTGDLAYRPYVEPVLAAADAADREQGIVRVKLDDELAEKIAQLISDRYIGNVSTRLPDTHAALATRDVLAVLREATQ